MRSQSQLARLAGPSHDDTGDGEPDLHHIRPSSPYAALPTTGPAPHHHCYDGYGDYHNRYGTVSLESPLTIPAQPHSHGLRSANSHLADKTKRRYRTRWSRRGRLLVDPLDCVLSTSVFTSVASRFIDALTAACNRCLSGDLPGSFAHLLLSGRCLPFKKKDDGVRPKAVGDVLRRLMAKIAFNQALPRAPELLPPTQVGVGVKEATPHVAAPAFRIAILHIDVSSAFLFAVRPEKCALFSPFPLLFWFFVLRYFCERSFAFFLWSMR